MKLRVRTGKQSGKEIVIDKDTMVFGKQVGCDVVFEGYDIAEKAFIIEKKGDICLLKALANRDIVISGEPCSEKILEPDDMIEAGKLRLEVSGGQHLSLQQLKKAKKNYTSRRSIIFLVFLLAVILGLMFITSIATDYLITRGSGKEAPAAKVTTKKTISMEDMVYEVAGARYNYELAQILYHDYEISDSNLAIAAIELSDNIISFHDVMPQPQIFYESRSALTEVGSRINERVLYLKRNAYIAMRTGHTTLAKDILTQIMNLVIDPTDKDYIWAKEKLLSMGGN